MHVHAARAGHLGKPLEAELAEQLLHLFGDHPQLRDGCAAVRIEIDAHLVGVVEVVPGHRPGMHLEAAEIHGPHHVREIRRAHELAGACRRKAHRHRLEPLGPGLGHALLVKALAAGTVGKTVEGDGPPADGAHHPFADGEEILDQLQLGLAARREVHLVGVRHAHGAAGDFDVDVFAHAPAIVAIRVGARNISAVPSAGIAAILDATQVIAVLGAHADPGRAAHYVPAYMKEHGYRVIGVNPRLAGQSLFGEPVRATLAELGPDLAVDMIDVFRRPADLAAHVPDILAMRPPPKVVWLQLGIADDDFAAALERHGIRVIQDRCLMVDHRRARG